MIPEPFTLERVAVDWTRHGRDDRPKILPPPGVEWRSASGKTKQKGRYYARPSSYAKALEDSFALNGWRLRRALVGIGQRRDYWVAASSLTIDDHDREALEQLAERCIEASGESAAIIGTALHTFTERVDRGEPVGNVPDEYRPLVDAWARITAPLKFMYREVRTVNDELKVAGTPDAFGYCSLPDPDGVVDDLRVIDLKSGSIKYPASMSTQLYLYAAPSTCLYDTETGERAPLEVNTRWGLIVHLKSDGTEPPGLYWINLEHGRQGAEVAQLVRAWRAVGPDAILLPALVELSAVEAPELVADITDAIRVASERVDVPSPIVEAVAATVDRILNEPPATLADRPLELVEVPPTFSTPAPDVCGWACPLPAGHGEPCVGALDDGDELTELDLRTRPDQPEGFDPSCRRCDLDRHTCPGCGANLRHGVEACDECSARVHAELVENAAVAAIERCITDRDLELLWTTDGHLWTTEVRDRAAEVMAELVERRTLERPRAALLAALQVADAARLRALWIEHGASPLWTPEHTAVAESRHAEVAAA